MGSDPMAKKVNSNLKRFLKRKNILTITEVLIINEVIL